MASDRGAAGDLGGGKHGVQAPPRTRGLAPLAVYTHLGAEELAELIAAYDVGELASVKGIAEGVSNSNWLVETTGRDGRGARFILTMYERRIDIAELPFFLGLLDHLAARGCAVPATIHDRDGASLRDLNGKAVALIEFLPGVSPSQPTPAQARAVGAALARVHVAAEDFAGRRRDRLDPAANLAIVEQLAPRLGEIDAALPAALGWALGVSEAWPDGLPRSVIHSDLFPDNVLMLGDRVTGMIDFYFACEGTMAYDLAVTHAAWSFGPGGHTFDAAIGRALVSGYETVRPLSEDERDVLPLLAEGACLRFTASRAEDWLEAPSGAHVVRKDPMDFYRRWQFYRDGGAGVFA